MKIWSQMFNYYKIWYWFLCNMPINSGLKIIFNIPGSHAYTGFWLSEAQFVYIRLCLLLLDKQEFLYGFWDNLF